MKESNIKNIHTRKQLFLHVRLFGKQYYSKFYWFAFGTFFVFKIIHKTLTSFTTDFKIPEVLHIILCLKNYVFLHFRWLKDLFKLGLRKSLDARDIYNNLKANDSAHLKVIFEEKWEKEKKRIKGKPRIFNVLWKISMSKILGISFLYSLVDILLR